MTVRDRSTDYAVRTLECPGCGQAVTGRFPVGQKYCSKACADAAPRPARRTGETHPCVVCGVDVYIPRNRLGKEFYACSAQHAKEWQGRNKVEYQCKTCGKAFSKSASFEKFGRVLYCSPTCRDADPEVRARLIEMNAEQQRGHQTEIERIGYALLDEMDVDYLPQHVIGGKFCVDAFVPAQGVVIQFDGDYWHAHPEKFPEPDARQRKRQRLDTSQDAYMRVCGYKVLRFWESTLHTDLKNVERVLREMLNTSVREDEGV